MPNFKKQAASRRTRVPRRVDYSSAFLKDWKRLSLTGCYDMMRLKAVMLQIIANDVPRSSESRDHALKSDLTNYRECHIGRDFLLIYCFDDTDRSSGGTAYFTRVGTHAQLFR